MVPEAWLEVLVIVQMEELVVEVNNSLRSVINSSPVQKLMHLSSVSRLEGSSSQKEDSSVKDTKSDLKS